MIFTDSKNNPLPTQVQLDPRGDGITVFSFDEQGMPLACVWTLQPSDPTVSPSYYGTLQGFTTSQSFVSSISIGPVVSAQYIPPDAALYKSTVHATLTATNGAAQRSLQINL